MKAPARPKRTKKTPRTKDLVRMTAADLAATHLWHLETREAPELCEDANTLGYCAQRAGLTEWMGSFRGQIVTLGWAWMLDERGFVRRLGVQPPRSNVLVVDADQEPLGPAAEPLLWAAVKGLQWRKVVAERLRGDTAGRDLMERTEALARVLRPAAEESNRSAPHARRRPTTVH